MQDKAQLKPTPEKGKLSEFGFINEKIHEYVPKQILLAESSPTNTNTSTSSGNGIAQPKLLPSDSDSTASAFPEPTHKKPCKSSQLVMKNLRTSNDT